MKKEDEICRYGTIVTSRTDLEPIKAWWSYNQRGTCDNKIYELNAESVEKGGIVVWKFLGL